MDIEKLKSLGTIKRFGAGEFICYEGAAGQDIFLILSGQVGVYSNSLGGGPKKAAILHTGDFLGEISLLENLPYQVSGIAKNEVIVLVVAKQNFRRFLQEMPDLAFNMMRGLSSRIRLLEENLQKTLLPAADELSSGQESGKKTILKSIAGESALGHLDGIGVFPEGHKHYGIYAPETYKNFCYNKQVSCPLCGGEFITKNPRMTKLRLEKRENDLRDRYVDFDPLWYNIRTCPHCFFTQHYVDFDETQRLGVKGLKPYQEKAKQLEGKITLPPLEPLTIDRVFLGYYLALYFAGGKEEKPLAMGKFYLSLSWLYQDVGDEGFYERSWNRAFDYYHSAYYGAGVTKLKPEHEQQLCIILGELYLRKGEVQEALKHFYAAIRRLDGANYYNNHARERYMEIKGEAKEKQR